MRDCGSGLNELRKPFPRLQNQSNPYNFIATRTLIALAFDLGAILIRVPRLLVPGLPPPHEESTENKNKYSSISQRTLNEQTLRRAFHQRITPSFVKHGHRGMRAQKRSPQSLPMIAAVYSCVDAFPPKSPVIALPSAMVPSAAFSILSA